MHQDVVGVLHIEIAREGQRSEQPEVQSDVILRGGLPCEVFAGDVGGRGAGDLLVLPDVVARADRKDVDAGVGAPYLLVSELAPRGAQFQFVEPPHVAHERLLRDAPAGRERREDAPFVVFGEFRRAVVADVGLDEVFLLVVVVETSEERHALDLGLPARVLLRRGIAHFERRQIGGQARAGSLVILVVPLSLLPSGQHLEIVVVARRGPVGEGDVARKVAVAVGRFGDRRLARGAFADGLRAVGSGEDRVKVHVRGVDLPRFGRAVVVDRTLQPQVFQQRQLQIEVAAEIPRFGLVETAGFAHGVVVEPVGPAVTLHLGVDHRAHGHDAVERVARAVHQIVLDARITGDVGRNLQPVPEQRAGRVDAEIILVVLRAFEDAVLPQIAHRQRVGQLVRAAVKLYIVVVQDRGLEIEIGPVAVGVERRIAAVAEMCDVVLAVTRLLARVEARLVVEVHVVDRPEQVGVAGHLLDRDVAVVLDLQAS